MEQSRQRGSLVPRPSQFRSLVWTCLHCVASKRGLLGNVWVCAPSYPHKTFTAASHSCLDRPCGLAADIEVPGSILGAARFSDQQWVCNEVHSALMRINEELLERKSSGSGLES
jgi:hypothetical protein